MNWSVDVLSTVSSDTEPTIVVTFDSAKYVFNVGENTTRAMAQSGRTWRKIRSIFLSRVCAERSSGLPGFLMTLADSGAKKISVMGPEGLLHHIASMRLYTYRDNMMVIPTEIPTNPVVSQPTGESTEPQSIFRDENLIVFAVPVLPSDQLSPVEDLTFALKRKRSDRFVEGRPSKRGTATVAGQAMSDPPIKYEVANTDSQIFSSSNSTSFRELDAQSSGIGLMHRSRSPHFSPSDLTADEAVEWRKLTIAHMFGSALESHEIQGATAERGSIVQNRKIKKAHNPAGSDYRLPTWTPSDSDKRQTVRSSEERVACSFIVRAHQPRGKFDARKAASLGLTPGPLRGKVARGETVEIKVKSSNGGESIRRIGPKDCLGVADKPTVLFIVDCPAPVYIDNLVASPSWDAYQVKEGIENPFYLHTIFHLLGDGVLENKQYLNWMKSFGPFVHHLVANRQYCPDRVAFTSAAFNQLKLHQLDERMFPLPYYRVDPSSCLRSLSSSIDIQPLLAAHHIGMRPINAPIIDKTATNHDLFHPAVLSPTLLALPQLTAEKFEQVRQAVSQERESRDGAEDVLIVPLGTSSSMPTKYRNVSSTLVCIPGYGNVILDCGEGTWGQLVRHFGPDTSNPNNVYHILRNLKCIFISHIHGDHHIGLSNLLTARQKLRPRHTEPLFLVADHAVLLYLKEYSDLEDLGFDNDDPCGVKPILSDTIHWKRSVVTDTKRSRENEGIKSYSDGDTTLIKRFQIAAQELKVALGLKCFQTVNVVHRAKCSGLIMKHTDGWSIVFSGDTMPCNNLVKAGAQATLLIHEATMGDDEAEQAEQKAHSTFSQAVDVGRRMNAQNTLLTHFSARYPKMAPPRNEPSTEEDPVLALALDNVSIPLHSMWRLNSYLPAIEQCFLDTTEAAVADEATKAGH